MPALVSEPAPLMTPEKVPVPALLALPMVSATALGVAALSCKASKPAPLIAPRLNAWLATVEPNVMPPVTEPGVTTLPVGIVTVALPSAFELARIVVPPVVEAVYVPKKLVFAAARVSVPVLRTAGVGPETFSFVKPVVLGPESPFAVAKVMLLLRVSMTPLVFPVNGCRRAETSSVFVPSHTSPGWLVVPVLERLSVIVPVVPSEPLLKPSNPPATTTLPVKVVALLPVIETPAWFELLLDAVVIVELPAIVPDTVKMSAADRVSARVRLLLRATGPERMSG